MTSLDQEMTAAQLADARLIWEYHQLHHPLRPCSAAIGLGSYDLGVARRAAELFTRDLFPVVVFTGGNSAMTKGLLPRGEAVHLREEALAKGMPESSILLETHATHTGENISLSRELLRQRGYDVTSVLLISMPYMERRAFATFRQQWSEIDVVCASEPTTFETFLAQSGDYRLVIEDLVGDLQRIIEYPTRGFSIAQEVPDCVLAACDRLIECGFDGRVLSP